MIDGLHIINFQSHADTEIEFCAGINAIIGATDSGKTAILRGLLWARYNKPSVEPNISSWALNDKGNQADETSVTVYKDGKELKRIKHKALNAYEVSGLKKPLEALGKGGMPVEVLKFFNMSDVNIQKQMDTPFLIGDSAPDVAKFLNTIVDMTEIDKYLSAALSKQRANTKDVKRYVKEVEDLENDLERFIPLEDAQILLKKYNKIGKRISSKEAYQQDLDVLITTYTTAEEQVGLLADVPAIEALLGKIEPIIRKKDDKKKSLKRLGKLITSHEAAVLVIATTLDVPAIEALLKKVKVHMNKRSEAAIKYKAVGALINIWEASIKSIDAASKEIKVLEKQLPSVCPLCGSPMKKEK